MLIAVASLVLGSLLQAAPTDAPLAPSDGISLAPNPTPKPAKTTMVVPAGHAPARAPLGVPVSINAAAALAAAGVGYRKRDDDPLIVIVHGDGGNGESFRQLVDRIGVPDSRVVHFDYAVVDGSGSSTTASHYVKTVDAAKALDDLIRGLAEEHSNIYSIHHSRGGSVGVEMIADLDQGVRPPIDGYRGAALLDPAIAAGALGALQSAGGGRSWVSGLIPDDGAFDPIRCDANGCHDVRVDLGERSGVEVIAIRNPDAELTNFVDRPEGLRVFDLPDPKPSARTYAFVHPLLGWARMTEAHGSVLSSELTAACIAAEIEEPGSCRALEPSARTTPTVPRFGGAGRNLVR